MISKTGLQNFNRPSFRQHESSETSKKMTMSQKTAVLASSAVGAGLVVAGLAKHNGFSLNPAKIAKTNIKDCALFKYKKGTNAIVYEEPQIIGVATGSVAGGFIGGAIVDKENLKAKKREVLNQILGNILVPVGCVGAGSRIFGKYANIIRNAMPQINKSGKIPKYVNIALKNMPNAVCTLLFLGAGIFAGNKVSNFINDKIYHKKVDRGIKATDFAPHIDDVCMATSMMNKESDFGAKLGRVIPFALLVPGYETGTARNQ